MTLFSKKTRPQLKFNLSQFKIVLIVQKNRIPFFRNTI